MNNLELTKIEISGSCINCESQFGENYSDFIIDIYKDKNSSDKDTYCSSCIKNCYYCKNNYIDYELGKYENKKKLETTSYASEYFKLKKIVSCRNYSNIHEDKFVCYKCILEEEKGTYDYLDYHEEPTYLCEECKIPCHLCKKIYVDGPPEMHNGYYACATCLYKIKKRCQFCDKYKLNFKQIKIENKLKLMCDLCQKKYI